MATKTFTQAQLTASDVNTFALKGDTFITSASVTAGSLINCFSSVYDNYKIVVSNFVATADCYLWIQGGYFSGTTWIGGGYYQGGAYQAYSTGTITTYSNNNALPYWQICAGCTAATGFPNSAIVNLTRPALNTRVAYTAQSTLHLSSGIYGWSHMGQNTSAQVIDSIRWSTTAGAVSSGTISVYGVMQA
jgi:hypothetical protein